MTEFTYFKGLFDINTPYTITTEKLINLIKTGGKIVPIIEELRKEKEKEKRDEIKRKKLPVILFSGKFTSRNEKDCHTHSGLIVLDIDDYSDNKNIRFELTNDDHTHILFTSPSGGIKLVVKIPAEIDNHKNHFRSLEKYYKDKFNVIIDKSGSDISRSCFSSYDPDIYFNPESKIYEHKIFDEHKTTEKVYFAIESEYIILSRLKKWFEKNYSLAEGQRNENLFKLVCALSDYGINKEQALMVLMSEYQCGLSESEVKSIVNSGYSKCALNFGTKKFEDSEKVERIGNSIRGKSLQEQKVILSKQGLDLNEKEIKDLEEKTEDKFNIFWEVKERKDGSLNISVVFDRLHKFLQKNGFFRIKLDSNSTEYHLIRLNNNILDSVDIPLIQDFIFEYLKEINEYEVLQHVQKSSQLYFSKEKILQLQEFTPCFYKDSEDFSYLFYRNGAVKISTEGTELISYFDFDGNLWKNQIINRDFESGSSECDFKKFVSNIQNNDEKRTLSLECVIGYLLSKHKPSKKAPAIVLNDEVDSDNPEGGTGKGLLIKAISQLRNVAIADGKSFNSQGDFALSQINLDTNIFCIDDVRQKFRFEEFFSLITEDWLVNKKYQAPFTINYKETPKLIFTTNYAIAGSSSSHRRRRWDIELHNYYNAEFTPYDDFKRAFFDEWDFEEWSKFDNYMIECLIKYLNYGYITPDYVNLEVRKLKSEVGEMFIDFIDGLNKHEFYSTSECLEKYIKRTNVRSITSKGFRTKLSKYCDFKNIEIEDKLHSGRRGFVLRNKK